MPSVRSLNKVMLIGNLTRDPEMRYTPKGTSVCGFTIATNRTWKDATGNRQEEATFHRISAWGKLGELLAGLLKQGMKVYVEATLHYTDKRDDQGKIIARQPDLRAAEVVILDGNRGGSPGMGGSDDHPASSSSDQVEELEIDDIIKNMEDESPEAAGSSKKQEIDDELPF